MNRRLFHPAQQIFLALVLGLGLSFASLWFLQGKFIPTAYAASFTVNTLIDAIGLGCSATCTLRDAIYTANTTPGNDTVYIPAGVYTLSLNGANEDAGMSGDLDIFGTGSGESLTIIGQGAAPADTVINANQIDRVFDIQPVGVTTVTLENLTIRGGFAHQGGGVRIRSTTMGALHLILNNVIITNNTIDGTNITPYPDSGGGLQNVQADVMLNNCQVFSNTAVISGGGLGNFGIMTLADTQVSTNTVQSGNGGGLSNTGNLTLRNSEVISNTAQSSNGGGISTVGSKDRAVLQISQSHVSLNQAGENGGGIFSSNSDNTLITVTLAQNKASEIGGGIYSTYSEISSTVSTIVENQAKNFAAGIFSANSVITLTKSSIADNKTNGNGGGILNDTSFLFLSEVSISHNQVTGTGGGIRQVNGSLVMMNSAVVDNESDLSGGGISLEYTNTVTITNCTLRGNKAFSGSSTSSNGGGLFEDDAFPKTITLNNVTIAENEADSGGGLAQTGSGVFNLANTIVASNTAYINADDLTGTFHSDGYNLIGDTTGVILTGTLTGNILDEQPKLGTLTGDRVYYPLLEGSPAVDAGSRRATPVGVYPACADIDQAGTTRPQGFWCDIGAFESFLYNGENTYLPILLR
jgi:CSLREA domain-containing protein